MSRNTKNKTGGRGLRLRENIDQALQMRIDGMSFKDIGARFGVSRQTAQQAIKPRLEALGILIEPVAPTVPTEPLRVWILDREIEYAVLAGMVGVDVPAISKRFQRGRCTCDTADQMCDALGILPIDIWPNWYELTDPALGKWKKLREKEQETYEVVNFYLGTDESEPNAHVMTWANRNWSQVVEVWHDYCDEHGFDKTPLDQGESA